MQFFHKLLHKHGLLSSTHYLPPPDDVPPAVPPNDPQATHEAPCRVQASLLILLEYFHDIVPVFAHSRVGKIRLKVCEHHNMSNWYIDDRRLVLVR